MIRSLPPLRPPQRALLPATLLSQVRLGRVLPACLPACLARLTYSLTHSFAPDLTCVTDDVLLLSSHASDTH